MPPDAPQDETPGQHRIAATLLSVRGLQAWYGESHVLHGMDFDIAEGEVVTLLGRNGVGKSTTLKAIMGELARRTGSVCYRSEQLITAQPYHIGRCGLAYCPEDRGIFGGLNVEENLMLPPVVQPGGMTLEAIYAMFPNLWERRKSGGTKLSGGEQQMLAIARILRTGARTLLLDEPTEGLAPVIVDVIGDVVRLLKSQGYTILLAEQNLHVAASVADRHYVVESGRVVDMVPAAALDRNNERLRSYLGV